MKRPPYHRSLARVHGSGLPGWPEPFLLRPADASECRRNRKTGCQCGVTGLHNSGRIAETPFDRRQPVNSVSCSDPLLLGRIELSAPLCAGRSFASALARHQGLIADAQRLLFVSPRRVHHEPQNLGALRRTLRPAGPVLHRPGTSTLPIHGHRAGSGIAGFWLPVRDSWRRPLRLPPSERLLRGRRLQSG
jgi:hypothetical protein